MSSPLPADMIPSARRYVNAPKKFDNVDSLLRRAMYTAEQEHGYGFVPQSPICPCKPSLSTAALDIVGNMTPVCLDFSGSTD